MCLLLRFVSGCLYAYGGWSVASGLRGRDDPTLNLGLGLMGMGLAIEACLNIWRKWAGRTADEKQSAEVNNQRKPD
jgi:hypothetical protein